MDKYWAAEVEEKIAGNIIEKFNEFRRHLSDIGAIAILRKSYKAYYGTHEIQDVGKSLKAINVNNYASLNRNLHVMITSQRPAWQPRAINSDLESQASVELGSGLLDFYMREKHLEQKLNRATEFALILREGWVVVDWDVNAGEVIAVDSDEGGKESTIFEGDISVQNFHILDVARDISKRDSYSHKWHIVRDFKNKFDLAATYPDISEKILSASNDNAENSAYDLNIYNMSKDMRSNSDLIPIYKLYHDKTPALPNGRLVVVVDKDCILFDGPMPYKKPYVFKISASDMIDMPFGHSNMFDLLPLQDALNLTFSSILTNQAANAVQNFQMPKGSGINVNNIGDGMRIIEFDPKVGGITPLDLLRTSPEVYSFNEIINNYMQLISNVSDISRGQAPANMSGTAMALLQQQSIQFNNGLQLAHTQLLEDVGTAVIELLQEFAEEPRLAIISGKTKAPLMKYFKGSDLKGINRVVVDSANPLTKTGAGRIEIANNLLQTPGMISTPDQYLSVLTTGILEPLYEHDRSRQHITRAENEALMTSQEVQAILTDDHAIHVLEHTCVLNNLEARKNPDIVNNVLAHIQEHIGLAETMTPQMAAMLKQTSFAQQPQEMVNPDLMQANNIQDQGVALPTPAQPPQLQ